MRQCFDKYPDKLFLDGPLRCLCRLQMTNYSNMGGYSFAACTYVCSHHICLLPFIYLIRKKTKLKNNKKFQGANVKAIHVYMVQMNLH